MPGSMLGRACSSQPQPSKQSATHSTSSLPHSSSGTLQARRSALTWMHASTSETGATSSSSQAPSSRLTGSETSIEKRLSMAQATIGSSITRDATFPTRVSHDGNHVGAKLPHGAPLTPAARYAARRRSHKTKTEQPTLLRFHPRQRAAAKPRLACRKVRVSAADRTGDRRDGVSRGAHACRSSGEQRLGTRQRIDRAYGANFDLEVAIGG